MTKRNKIHYLDGLRGAAAFVVLLHHFFLAFMPAYSSWEPEHTHLRGWDIAYGKSLFSIVTNGNFAVFVFFALSGFVLSRQYIHTGKSEQVVSAAMRRFIRLYIPTAATIILAYGMLKAGWFFNVPVSKAAGSEWWMGSFWLMKNPEAQLATSLSYSTMFSGDGTFDTSLWTISIEFFGSLLVFAFLALTHNVRHRVIALAATLVYFLLFGKYYYATFLIGVAMHYIKPWTMRAGVLRNLLCAALLCIAILMGASPAGQGLLPPLREVLGGWEGELQCYHMLASTALITALLMSPHMQAFFSLRLFRFLGNISFSLYLLHALVMGSLGCLVFLKLWGPIGYSGAVLVALVTTIAVTVVASYVMTRWVDEKGIQLSKFVYGRWFSPAQQIQPVKESAVAAEKPVEEIV